MTDAEPAPAEWLDRLTDRPVVGPVVEVARRLVSEWREDRVPGLASEVAFWAVLSLFPALLALGAAVGFLQPVAGDDFADDARAEVVEWTEQVLGGEQSNIATQTNELFERRSTGVFTISVVLAVWAASRGFGALIRALDVVYDLDERRGWLSVRTTAVGLALGSLVVAAIVLAMVVVGPLLGRGRDIADDIGAGGTFVTVWTWARPPFVLAVLVAWAATVFHIAPNHHTPWRWDVPGAVLTTSLWIAGIGGFRLYLELAADGNGVFGVLGGALTLMLCMYVTALAVLLGGELNAILAERFGGGRRLDASPTRRLRARVLDRVRTGRRPHTDTVEPGVDDTRRVDDS